MYFNLIFRLEIIYLKFYYSKPPSFIIIIIHSYSEIRVIHIASGPRGSYHATTGIVVHFGAMGL